MGNPWELTEVTNTSCDRCASAASCNIYRRKIEAAENTYRYLAVCGYCMGEWLKSRSLDVD